MRRELRRWYTEVEAAGARSGSGIGSEMKPEKLGRLLGTGVRVAGRVMSEREEDARRAVAAGRRIEGEIRGEVENAARAEMGQAARKATRVVGRAAGRGAGGFLRPFRRVGGILWLEVTGFFFGLFAVYFGADVWRVRAALHGGTEHERLLLSAAAAMGFAYLCVSAFWRARRR